MSGLAVRPVGPDDIAVLDERLPRGRPGVHSERLQAQTQGLGLYATAWYGESPAGILFVYWQGPAGSLVRYWEGPGAEQVRGRYPDCPVLIDLFVVPEYRRRGIATKLLEYVETEARQKGYGRIGLNVGDGSGPEYALPRGIYTRRGYRDSGLGSYKDSYTVLDETGKESLIEESVIFMVKVLGGEGV